MYMREIKFVRVIIEANEANSLGDPEPRALFFSDLVEDSYGKEIFSRALQSMTPIRNKIFNIYESHQLIIHENTYDAYLS